MDCGGIYAVEGAVDAKGVYWAPGFGLRREVNHMNPCTRLVAVATLLAAVAPPLCAEPDMLTSGARVPLDALVQEAL